MTKTITTMPTLGERAIITRYGFRTPATCVNVCNKPGHGVMAHWCYDEPNPNGVTWSGDTHVEREPIPTEPREWQPGDVVDHPERGRGLVRDSVVVPGVLRVMWTFGNTVPLGNVADDLTLVLAAPEPPKPDEPTGLGAVVRDKDDVLWVQADSDDAPWVNQYSEWSVWASIHAVEILSEGVEL